MLDRSSIEAKYEHVAHVTYELSWLPHLITKLQVCFSAPIVWIDNLSIASLTCNPILHQKTNHLGIDLHFLRDKVLEKFMEIQYVSFEEKIVNLFTKALGTARYLYLRTRLKKINTLS